MKHSQSIPLILTAAALGTAVAWTANSSLSRVALDLTSGAFFATGASYVYKKTRQVIRHIVTCKVSMISQVFQPDSGIQDSWFNYRIALARAPPFT